MPMDGAMLHALVDELKPALTGGRVDKIYQINDTDLLLKFRVQSRTRNLLVSAHATKAHLMMTDQPPTAPTSPPLLTMVLRKHLSGGRLTDIVQDGLDRTIHLHFEATDDIGDRTRRTLAIEIMGKHSNIILFDTDSRTIIDSLKKVNHLISRHREVLPGRPYILPPGQNQTNLLDLDPEQVSALLVDQDGDLASVLSRTFEGISRKTFEYLLPRKGLEHQQVDEMGEWEYQLLGELLDEFSKSLQSGQHQPTLEQTDRGTLDCFLFPSPVIENPLTFSTTNDMIDAMIRRQSLVDALGKTRNQLSRQIRGWTTKLEKKASIHEKNLQKAEETRIWQLRGELLTVNLHQVRPGMKELTVSNYYDPDHSDFTIPLDPSLSPSANASRFFKKVGKVREAAKVSRRMLGTIRSDLDYLASVEDAVGRAETLAELDEITAELVKTGFLAPPRGKHKKKPAPGSTPLVFRSTGGFLIYVGKNNRQNDWLTMKQAAPEDLWFHVRQMPGAHVILKTGGRQPDERSLLEAATLAAWFSRGQNSTKVPVDYTTRKHLRKPKGAKPGMVIYDTFQTLLTDPDPALLDKLRVSES